MISAEEKGIPSGIVDREVVKQFFNTTSNVSLTNNNKKVSVVVSTKASASPPPAQSPQGQTSSTSSAFANIYKQHLKLSATNANNNKGSSVLPNCLNPTSSYAKNSNREKLLLEEANEENFQNLKNNLSSSFHLKQAREDKVNFNQQHIQISYQQSKSNTGNAITYYDEHSDEDSNCNDSISNQDDESEGLYQNGLPLPIYNNYFSSFNNPASLQQQQQDQNLSNHSPHAQSAAVLAQLPSLLKCKFFESPINHSQLQYDCAAPIARNTPENNEVKLIEYRDNKVASFTVDGKELICLPQAFELFLKNLVGGLHTVYTKLKRLDIVPIVCNVEQVHIFTYLLYLNFFEYIFNVCYTLNHLLFSLCLGKSIKKSGSNPTRSK
jgi:hypothetical protein